MKVHLMFRDRDFHAGKKMPPNEDALSQDLELPILFEAMAAGDEFVHQAARQAIVSGVYNDLETILYRQAVLRDCLRHYPGVKCIYDLAREATDSKQQHWLGIFSRYPGGILSDAIGHLRMLTGLLDRLRGLTDEHSDEFDSEGFKALFDQIKTELTEEYSGRIKKDLQDLQFRRGVLVSAALEDENQGTHYVLRKTPDPHQSWLGRLFSKKPRALTVRIHPRDEAGARALSDLRDRGINQVANALAQSADHIQNFFVTLQTELAFYLGCVNLHRKLAAMEAPVCFPTPAAIGSRMHQAVSLCDICLILRTGQNVVGNDLYADGISLVIITGANQGGKTTFLRGIGAAQLMMQAGMFVTAEAFEAEICGGLFTHYKHEEDATMTSGKFAEELSRMSHIADMLVPNSILLFNESFAATNELEGSEIARQIVSALLEARMKVFFITHLYEFANRFWKGPESNVLFLKAERGTDGSRPFKLLPGQPLQTSFGADLYERIFGGREIGGGGKMEPLTVGPALTGERRDVS